MTDVLDDITIPDDADGLREFISNRKTRELVFKTGADPKIATEFMTKYANAFNKKDAGAVEEQVAEQVERAMASYMRDKGYELRKGDRKATAADVRAQRQTATYKSEKIAPGAPLNGEFEDLYQFLDTVHPRTRERNRPETEAKIAKIEAAMSSTDPGSGGFLIPEEFRATLMSVALESAVVRPRATVIPMNSLRVAMPIVDVTSNVSSVYGGIVGYWTEEGAALVQSQPAFGRVVLEAKKLTAYTEVPNELRRDSAISVEMFLNEIMPRGIAWYEDVAFMFGSGAGEPLGVFNALNNAIVVQAAETGQAASTVVWENIVGMYARMLPTSLNNAVWVVSPAVLPQLFTMGMIVGTGGSWVGPVVNSFGTGTPVLTLLGRPIIISEKVSNLTTQGDVNFVDFGQYLVGDRMQMEAEVSTDYKFGNDLTAYRFIERVDGRPWLQSAITPRNGGPALSPYVQLAGR
jgi:HK97 family phage major capsid protein